MGIDSDASQPRPEGGGNASQDSPLAARSTQRDPSQQISSSFRPAAFTSRGNEADRALGEQIRFNLRQATRGTGPYTRATQQQDTSISPAEDGFEAVRTYGGDREEEDLVPGAVGKGSQNVPP